VEGEIGWENLCVRNCVENFRSQEIVQGTLHGMQYSSRNLGRNLSDVISVKEHATGEIGWKTHGTKKSVGNIWMGEIGQ